MKTYAVLIDVGTCTDDVVFVLARSHEEALKMALHSLNIPEEKVRQATITPQKDVSDVN